MASGSCGANCLTERDWRWLPTTALSVALHLGLLFALPVGGGLPRGEAPLRQALQLHWQTAVETAADQPRPRRHDLLVAPRPGPPAEQVNRPSPVAGEPAPAESHRPSSEMLLAGEVVRQQVHYYRRSELDRVPQIVEDVAADGSPLAETLGRLDAGGRVVLELWINGVGQVDRSEVLVSSLGPASVALIRSAFGQARFLPARIGEQAVASRLQIELTVSDVLAESVGPPPLAPVSP